MDRTIIAACMSQSFADTPFPVVVGQLAAAGVRSYTADLVRMHSIYYGDGQEMEDKALPLATGPDVASAFDGGRVASAVQAIQRGEIGYAAFLQDIKAAGCANYSVYIAGRKVIYRGRDGAAHIELFPPANA